MPCPSCGYVVADHGASQCPNCGRLLALPAHTAPADPSPTSAGAPLSGQGFSSPPDAGAYPSYGSQPSSPTNPTYPEQPAPPNAQLPPGYYAPPNAPLGYPPQYAAPSMPLPQGSYAPGMPLGAPPQYAPQGYPPYFAPPPPPPVRRKGPVIAIVASILVVIALIGAGGAAVLLSHKDTPAGTPGAQTSYSGTNAAGPAATPTVTPDVNVLFQDNFTSNSSGWTNDSQCSYGPDGYHVADDYICYSPTGEIGDAVVSADIKQISGDTTWFYGIVFRRQSAGNLYELFIDSNGKWEFNKEVNNTRSHLLPYVPSSAIHTGLNVINTLSARAVGSHFEFFINGTQVGHFDDPTFTMGKCGIASAGDGSISIVATQFALSTPN